VTLDEKVVRHVVTAALKASIRHGAPRLSRTCTKPVASASLAFGVLLDDLVRCCVDEDGKPVVTLVVSASNKAVFDSLDAFERLRPPNAHATYWARSEDGTCCTLYGAWRDQFTIVLSDGLIDGRMLAVGPSRVFSADLIVRNPVTKDD
jgi:hypothetical protein